MSKELSSTQANIEETIMAKVKSNQISMKPRWYFILGSLFAIVGFVCFTIGAIFLTNLTLFLLRGHGPMGQWRLQVILNSFPWWIPVLAIIGIVLGAVLLKKYDFSYKNNFWLIVAGFVAIVFLVGLIIDYSGINDTWSRIGPMKRFYQQIEGQNSSIPMGVGQGGGMHNGQGNRILQQDR